jgi:hypothetical protein
LCWSNVGHITQNDTKDIEYADEYVRKRVKKGIFIKGIFPYEKTSLRYKKDSKKALREMYLVKKNTYDFEKEINIYDDKVAIASSLEHSGVIIQGKSIANTMRSIFEFSFQQAKMLEPSLLTEKDKKYLSGSN